ncbi:peroxisomal nicotinamide adenine dinucleotide carrier-like isoform X2 [Malania oleifera]|uniref:peroxisomal nicotinamide adenine dinucleotide carrier-like isoform X2 n=1 Tax=Malania oleifera TaxID=397392 RepID=UPI0025AEAF40|nr:peroxisomal nicotinamide adenine dinucleotide carrier-like isoform X2 [Malania oleifera]
MPLMELSFPRIPSLQQSCREGRACKQSELAADNIRGSSAALPTLEVDKVKGMSNAVANGLAGAGGGIIAQIATYPLQAVNTRQQTERIAKKDLANSSGSLPSPNRFAGGTLVQILQVIRSEGWGGLYSGLKPSLLGTAVSQGVYYYFYQVFKNTAEAIAAAQRDNGHGDGTVGMFSWLFVAAIAGSLNVLLTNPIWILVTRMQTHTQAERKIMEAKEAALREAFESGLIDSSSLQEKLTEIHTVKPSPYGMLHAVCNPSIQFMIYESSLKHLRAKRATNKQGLKNVTALEVFLLGALAKLGATISTYPLLVVKSRLQAKQEIGGSNSLRYSGTLDAIIKMIRHEGLPGFYRGMSTKIMQSVFAASVLFMVKEELVKAYMALAVKSRKVLLGVVK